MTVLSSAVGDVGGQPITKPVWIKATRLRQGSDAGSVVDTAALKVEPVNGVLVTPDLEPGPAVITWGLTDFHVTIPDVTTASWWSVLALAVGVPPDTTEQQIADALSQYLAANPIEGAGGVADGAVTEPKLADSGVTAPKLAPDSVIGVKIAAGAVSRSKLSTALQNELDSKPSATVVSEALGFKADAAAVSTALAAKLSETTADARYVPVWLPTTPYAAGKVVLAGDGSGTIVKRKTAGTSGTTYDPANWDIVASGSLPSGGTTGQLLAKTSTSATWVDAPVGGGKSYATYDVRDYVQAGETLYTDGSASVSAIIQRAVNAANGAYALTGPSVVLLPAGRFRLDTSLAWRTGVGLRGESMGRTVLLPYAGQTALQAIATPAAPLTDCHFTDFTIDGINHSWTSYQTGIKGFFFQHMLRARFERVTVKNTWGSGFGVDFLRDSLFQGCIADNCGRGVIVMGVARSAALGGSGFGIGTGASEVEAVTISDCWALNNAVHGIFVEVQTPGTTGVTPSWSSKGLKVIGCHASGNYWGFRDSGNKGTIVTGCYFYRNENSGVYISKTSLAPVAASLGLVSSCTITENGIGDTSGGGVVVNSCADGSYTFADLKVHNNTGYGFRFGTSNTSTVGPHIAVRGCDIFANTLAGINAPAGDNPILDLLIEANAIYGNGTDTAGTRREGIVIGIQTTRLSILRNTISGHAAAAIALIGTKTVTDPTLLDNDLRGNTATFTTTHTVAGLQLVKHVGENAYTSTSGSAVAPVVTSAAPPAGTVAGAYSHTFAASGTGPITWAVTTGSLPAGLTLSTAGVLSGTPTAAATTAFTVTATNTAGGGTQNVSLVVGAAQPADTTAPTVPGTPVATAGAGSASVAFPLSTDAVGPITYRVYANGGATPVATGASSPIVAPGTAGTAYTYTVDAIDGAGNPSAKSAASNSVTPTASTGVTDAFGGGDVASIAGRTTETGGLTWAVAGGTTVGIVGGGAKVTGGASTSSVAYVPTSSANGTLQCTLVNTSGAPATAIAGLAFRITDANNYFVLQIRTDATTFKYTLTRRNSGTATQLGSVTTPLPANGDVLKVVLNAATIDVFVNNVELFPAVTDTFRQTVVNHGLFFNFADTVTVLDNFSFVAA